MEGYLQIMDEKFAEIEYEYPQKSLAAAVSAQRIMKKAADPAREKFYDMRSLASYNSFMRDEAALFYKQAKFMEDFDDDFQGYAEFFQYHPSYQRMGYEQLRSYFTWRAKVRKGEIKKCDLSYVFMYIYELLSGIGVNSPLEGLDKLMALWLVFNDEAVFDKYLPVWLKDYHIYYELPHSFADFVSRYNLQKFYPEMFLFELDDENTLELWNSLSNYDVTKSKFYIEGNQEQLHKCFSDVIKAVKILNIDNLLFYTSKGMAWQPFRRALFYNWMQQPDRTVELPGKEIYYCKDNRWTADIPIFYSGRKDFFGYIIKKMESCLRQAAKYKYKITANPNNLYNISPKLKDLDKLIEKAVAGYIASQRRTVVNVDQINLARIREEAIGTQDKLIVEEAGVLPVLMPEPAKPVNSNELPAGWESLKESLSVTEREALLLLLKDGMEAVKIFADEKAIMPEILVDSINEKAADHIGDNIIEFEDDLIIYEEYKAKVTEMVG